MDPASVLFTIGSMNVTLGTVATAASIGSTIMGAFDSYQQGVYQQSAANFEKAQLQEQRQLSQLQAMQDENERRRRLNAVLSSNTAAAASQGFDISGRSFLAIEDQNIRDANSDIGNIRLNAATNNRLYGLGIQQKTMEGKAARTIGRTGALGSLLKGGYNTLTNLPSMGADD